MRVSKLFVIALFGAGSHSAAALEWNTPESRARWSDLSHAMYGAEAKLDAAQGALTLSAPDEARDAALVPIELKVAPATPLRELDLVIDQNPSPVAARVKFGAAGDPRQLKLRVRVNAFTNMHAVGILQSGKLLQSVAYVQGAGGCSAPMGASEAEASKNMGEMRLKIGSSDTFGDARVLTLMVRHPNFNGMQMNETTHALTPARYIKLVVVTRGEAAILEMSTDISLSTNPVLEFLYRPEIEKGKPIKVTVVDTTGKSWTQEFEVPGQGSATAAAFPVSHPGD